MKLPSLKSFCFLYVVFWVVSVVYILTPGGLDIPRILSEYRYWLKLVFWSWYRIINETWLYSDYAGLVDAMGKFKTFPKNDAPLTYLTYTRDNFTLEDVYEKTNMDIPFIVKNFAPVIAKFNYDYVMETFQDDEYNFEVGHVDPDLPENCTSRSEVIMERVQYPLKKGLKKMKETKDLYLRFAQTLTQNNPEFDEALIDAIDSIGPMFPKLIGQMPNANRLCFIGMGEKSKTIQHNAITDNWFLQASGRKRWVLVPPQYTPYMKAIFTNTIAMGSLLPIYKEEMGIPVVEIISEPGDLLFFPGFWWHEVNNEGEFNFGCGVRPRENIARLFKSLIFPPVTFPSGCLGVYLGLFPSAMKVIYENFPIAKLLTGDVGSFDAKNHQKWWAKDQKKEGETADKEEI